MEDDLCIVQIDFLRAHFTVYQPAVSANTEYCEDIPKVSETIFVLDYLHDSLKEMPVDFRIIRDTTGLGRFARWSDVAALPDIERDTEFYQPPVIRPGATLSVDHTFTKPGNYIGIVTTKHPDRDKVYRAVFPFEVGGGGFGYWPLIIVLLIFVQLNYWVMSGGYSRWRASRNAPQPEE